MLDYLLHEDRRADDVADLLLDRGGIEPESANGHQGLHDTGAPLQGVRHVRRDAARPYSEAQHRPEREGHYGHER